MVSVNMHIYKLVMICLVTFVVGCGTSIVEQNEESSMPPAEEGMNEISAMECNPVQNVEFILPKTLIRGQVIPIIVRVKHQGADNIDIAVNGYSTILSNGSAANVDRMKITKGVGSTLYELPSDDTFTFAISHNDFSTCYRSEITDGNNVRRLSGVLSGPNLIWGQDEIIEIDGDVIIPKNTVLHLGEDTIVQLTRNGRIIVGGSIESIGSSARPVLFTSVDSNLPWGEISHEEGSSGRYEYTLFINGGGDTDRAEGHSGSQPVVRMNRSTVDFNNVFFMDNPGKAMLSKYSRVNMSNCIITRSDTGGEHHRSYLRVSDSYFLDMPSDDGIYADDDNDALYLSDSYEDENGEILQSHIERTYFITGKDDGLDHTGAYVLVDKCWFEGFMHEGIAASLKDRITIRNAVISGNQQGVEAGYGAPSVLVDHSLIFGNEVGVRFGDSHGESSVGEIAVQNSIITKNRAHNMLDWVWNDECTPEDGEELILPDSGTPICGRDSNQVHVEYSVMDDDSFDCATCLIGTPHLSATYHLAEDSIGRSAGNDGLDVGLLSDFDM